MVSQVAYAESSKTLRKYLKAGLSKTILGFFSLLNADSKAS